MVEVTVTSGISFCGSAASARPETQDRRASPGRNVRNWQKAAARVDYWLPNRLSRRRSGATLRR
jgi:hypothetical protein